MLFRVLGLCLFLSTTASFAQGRGPAVEDFVGIEVEQDQAVPQGADILINLEKDINKIEAQKDNKPAARKVIHAPTATAWNVANIITAVLGLGLPIFIWLMMMSHLKRQATAENASNLEVLEKYRQERTKKKEEEFRKAS